MRHVRSVTAKAAYSRAARKKLIESRARLDRVEAEVARAIAAGSLGSNDKLENAQRSMEARLATAEARLVTLQKSGEDGWEGLRDELENTWEDLSYSINRLVAQLKDVSG